MTEPGLAELGRLLGHIESKVDGVSVTVDRIDEKVDGHAVRLAEHELRLGRIEADQAAAKLAATENTRLRTSNRVALICAAIGGVCGVVGAAITIIVH